MANLFGATSLVKDLDTRVLVVLRDGKHIAGKLVSLDQFGNLVLEAAAERYYGATKMAEIPVGCMIVRSDNIVLVAAIDEHKEKNGPLQLVSYQELEKELKEQQGKEGPSNNISNSLEWNFDS